MELRFGFTKDGNITHRKRVSLEPYYTKFNRRILMTYYTSHEPERLKELFEKAELSTKGLTLVAGLTEGGRYSTSLVAEYYEDENGNLIKLRRE